MRSFKTAITIAATVAVLIAMAYIPMLVSHVWDREATGKSTLETIASIELNIRQELSSTQKLAMMSRIHSLLPIRENKARMTPEDVMDAVLEGLTPYLDAQLAVYREDRVEIQPFLVQIPEAPELQSVLWQVTVSGSDDDFVFFDLLLDDATGSILRISYTVEDPAGMPTGMEALLQFADIFFPGLGIQDHWEYAAPDLDYASAGDNGTAIRFRFEDAQYGEITVDLNVHDHGFYVEYPQV